MIDSRLSLAASCSRSTRFFNASCTSPIAFLRLYQLPDAPPPPLLPPPKPPSRPPPEQPPCPLLCDPREPDESHRRRAGRRTRRLANRNPSRQASAQSTSRHRRPLAI